MTCPLPPFPSCFVPPAGHTGFSSAPQISRACSCIKAFALAVLSPKLFSQFRMTGALTFRSQLQCHLLRGWLSLTHPCTPLDCGIIFTALITIYNDFEMLGSLTMLSPPYHQYLIMCLAPVKPQQIFFEWTSEWSKQPAQYVIVLETLQGVPGKQWAACWS